MLCYAFISNSKTFLGDVKKNLLQKSHSLSNSKNPQIKERNAKASSLAVCILCTYVDTRKQCRAMSAPVACFVVSSPFAKHECSVCSGVFVPCRALRRHASENVLRFGVRDWDDVVVEWIYDFLHVCVSSGLSGARALCVGVGGEGQAGGRRGAKGRVGDWKRRGEPRFGAGHRRVVTLQEVLVHLAVSLLWEDNNDSVKTTQLFDRLKTNNRSLTSGWNNVSSLYIVNFKKLYSIF